MDFLTIILFIPFLGILLFVHEFGHFIVSKMCGIEVEEFGFGFPPRALKLFRWKGTDFTLNWIPFGAFVKPKGEDDSNVAGGMASANPWKRLAVLLGGPITNLLIGILVFSIIFVPTAPDVSRVLIAEVAADSPALTAGLQKDDQILTVNSTSISDLESFTTAINANLGKQISVTFSRNGQVHEIQAVPRQNPPQGQGALGVRITNPRIDTTNIFQAMPYALIFTGDQARQLFMMPVRLIQGTIRPDQARLVGPVGMGQMFGQALQADIQAAETGTSRVINILYLLGVISVALGLTNLLPIPALDGGRIIFVLPEIIFKKKVPQNYENLVHTAGFLLLILLLIVITFQDIFNPIIK